MTTLVLKFLLRYLPYVLAIGAAIAALVYIVGMIDQGGYDRADREWQAKWAEQQQKIAESKLADANRIRELEGQLSTAYDEVSKDAQSTINRLKTDIDNGRTVADSLRNKTNQLYAKLRECSSATTVASGSESARSPADVLSELYSRSEQRATELAGYADELNISLGTCTVLYNTARDRLAKASANDGANTGQDGD